MGTQRYNSGHTGWLGLAALKPLSDLFTRSGPEDAETETDVIHKTRMLTVLATLCAVFFFIFSISYCLAGRWISVAILTCAGAGTIGLLAYLRSSRKLRAMALMISMVVAAACLIFLHYYQPNNLGFLWSIMVPFLTVLTLGHRTGGRISLAYIAVAGIALLIPDNPFLTERYPPGLPIRFIAMLLGIFLVVYYVEHARTRATRALRSSDRRFRALIENSASVYAVVGADGAVLYESPSLKRVYGYEPEDLVGSNILALVHPDDRKAAIEEIELLILNPEQVRTAETRYLHKDGSWRDISVSGVNLLHDPDVAGVILTSHEVISLLEHSLDKRIAIR